MNGNLIAFFYPVKSHKLLLTQKLKVLYFELLLKLEHFSSNSAIWEEKMSKSLPRLEMLAPRERQVVETVLRLGEASVGDVLAAIPDPPTYSGIRAILSHFDRSVTVTALISTVRA